MTSDSKMAYTNSYKAPAADVPNNCHLDTKPEEYDFNFMFDVKSLRSDRVELRPFVVSCVRLRRGLVREVGMLSCGVEGWGAGWSSPCAHLNSVVPILHPPRCSILP